MNQRGHAAWTLDRDVEIQWIGSESLERPGGTDVLDEADGILAAAKEEMQAAVDFGIESPFPAPEEATKYVYA